MTKDGASPKTKPLPSLLTAREYARVARTVGLRVPRNTDMSGNEYRAKLWEVARELYPTKVS